MFRAIANNNVRLAIRDGASGRFSASGLFSVIPAEAGIQSLDPGSKPVPDSDPGSGVTVSFLPIGQRFGQSLYISYNDFNRIIVACSLWTREIFQTLYFTGMRRGEALGLTWDNVNLPGRIIVLTQSQTKERRSKRVPIHRLLVPILENLSVARSEIHDRVFLNDKGELPHEDSLTRAWRTAVKRLDINPRPTVHDLRHCWKTNAMRSGVNPAIADMIVGHGNRKKDVKSLYLSISDADLPAAIDAMEFDAGETEIWVKKRGNVEPSR